ncbi:MAG: cupin-like domain-containing protein [Sphingomonadaceae bacterium]
MLKPQTFRPDDPLRALGIRPAAAALEEAQLREIAVLKARLAKRDWLLACRAKLEAQASRDVPRLHAPDPEHFFREHWCLLRPCVLTGLVDHWPARQLWSLDHFRSFGNPDVEVQTARESDPDFEIRSPEHRTRMPWQQLLDLLAEDRTTNDFYVTANNGSVNRKALARLWDEIGPVPGFLAKNRMGDGFFWMGPRGTITPWHHDLTQNFLLQLAGEKRVTLAAPHATPAMQNHRHCFSRFGQEARPAQGPETFTVTIGPGEILFIPVGWWHHVEGLSMTIGMSFTNFVWDNDFESFLPPAARGDL